jgi:nickel superoxide dismutase
LISNSTPVVAPAAPVLHCQVPCGIYGDQLRIEMMMEDLSTVEKAMGKLIAFQAEESPNLNQVVRWTMAKDEHAQKIQDQVAGYWLAQRIKLPSAEPDKASMIKYYGQLAYMHQVTVAAMKCKQGTDVAQVANLKSAAIEFSKGYFNEKDFDHIESHHKGDHK